ncbi:hypothetical protein HBA54_07545 [Pelagibius litoralis]|uniref:HEPN domain-containing protein n=1 Tax=Pelagibius litoralis TaxID=374515 RepID=A0A967CBS9_9PROT|nr:hypothetical protein [Pelagibius litoralis]NIA68444.1 hypothetical protein [Pelagibius litoralis]
MTKEISDGFKWPSKGDRLLRAENDWDKSVTFAEHDIARDVHIWDGYMRAGAVLVEQCQLSKDRVDRHELIYPILFCYRHGLELAMKWIIGQYGGWAGIQIDDYLHHDLWKLWTACKKVMVEVGSAEEIDGLHATEQVVRDFHELDKGSFSFRYSRDLNGMTIRLPDVPFDLANIKEVMEAVNNLFTGADGQLDYNTGSFEW